MREMTARLAEDASWPPPTARAHEDYLARRDAIERAAPASPAPAACRTG